MYIIIHNHNIIILFIHTHICYIQLHNYTYKTYIHTCGCSVWIQFNLCLSVHLVPTASSK